MQDLAREMLKDMPLAKNMTPFSQSVNPNSTSGVSYTQIGRNSADSFDEPHPMAGYMQPGDRFALDPNSVPLPTPPERQPGEINRASFSNALNQRPMGDELDEEPYTPEAIAQLTNRDARKGSKNAARFSGDSETKIKVMRIGKELAVPIVALLVMIAMVLYLVSGTSKTTAPAGSSKTAATAKPADKGAADKGGEEIALESADGKKSLQLVPPDQAYFITATGTTVVPYNQVGNNWQDYFTVLKSSVTEKQLWYEKKPSTYRGEDGSVYYLKGSPEGKVLDKMHQLAGWAQSYYLRTGEYPRMIPEGAFGDFSYINPFTGKGYNIIIRQVHCDTIDAAQLRMTLESGALLGNDATNVPGDIGCYAALMGDEKTGSTRCVKFFVRGSDVEGHHLASGEPGKVYVVSAGNEHLSRAMLTTAPTADKKVSKVKTRTSRGKKVKADAKTDKKADKKPTETPAADPTNASLQNARPPEKASRMLIVENPPVALTILHYILPMLLFGLTLACFGRSQMQGFDIKGKAVTQGSSMTLNLAMGCFCLTLLVIVLQFVVFR